ncbi:hypothetical protein [Legionella feeleii]|uniref:Uncharacterized protein n=1 Tax=Legionella feeleii TaxID=453 RepID=A0A0W0U3Q8_9GAMM|nr:hypothetical protein [Legionella feeleii]KTD02658.1 hypothetical protein Lfee_0813 [Legionella feeleii]SPX61214.1 Uncharacterised protein [Legionella feeleii]
MSDFITILESSVVVASTEKGVRTTDQFQNTPAKEILPRLKHASIGKKDGSHFLRTGLKENNTEYCMARSDNNTQSMASLLIIDCDKTLINERDEQNGAPDPYQVSESLKKLGIGHIIFGSYSYYLGITRYRILLVTKSPYIKEQLAPTAESIVALINTNLGGNLLAYVPENGVWSQAWYYPRKPENSTQSDSLYIEYLEGNAVDVINPQSIMEINNDIKREIPENFGEISPIRVFNEQYALRDLLTGYGYKLVLVTKDRERWLSPDSLSGIAGVTVKDNKFFCHHSNDPFHDGYWHDAFDLMRIKEGLTDKDAIIQAALRTRAPNGHTVDEYNKSLAKQK